VCVCVCVRMCVCVCLCVCVCVCVFSGCNYQFVVSLVMDSDALTNGRCDEFCSTTDRSCGLRTLALVSFRDGKLTPSFEFVCLERHAA
jgi:hypothetical protein